jgi:hypothetical protein
MYKRLLCLLLVLGLSAPPASASWLSEITGIDVNIPAGTVEVKAPNPAAIPEMLRNLPKDVGQALLNPAGSALATAIRHAAAQARWGAQPIPDDVKSRLAPYIPGHILNKAVWTVFDGNRITLDTQLLRACWDTVNAITLDNVIVFKRSPSRERVDLWAHELVHVMQYDNMGVEGFANVYSYNWNSLENPAYSLQDSVASQTSQSSSAPAALKYVVHQPFGSAQLNAQQFAQAARNFYPPATCARIQNVPGGAYVTNVCPVPIWVTGWTQATNWGPAFVQCAGPCGLWPAQTQPVWSSVGGPLVDIGFRY